MDYRPRPTSKPEEDKWKTCIEKTKAYDEADVDGWIKDTDNYIIFATLFSAIVTAFNIESYTLLREDPDTVTQLLSQISDQLSSFSVTNGFINSTVPAQYPFLQFEAPAYAVRINAFWFSSLVFSVTYAMIAITMRQWLREYLGWTDEDSRSSFRLRQYRYARMEKWGIPVIKGFLPLLLQIAVTLFLIGLCEFVWVLDHIIAIFVIVPSAVLGLFMWVTTFIPLFFPTSPYKSHHALLINNAFQVCLLGFRTTTSLVHQLLLPAITFLPYTVCDALCSRYKDWIARPGPVQTSISATSDGTSRIWNIYQRPSPVVSTILGSPSSVQTETDMPSINPVQMYAAWLHRKSTIFFLWIYKKWDILASWIYKKCIVSAFLIYQKWMEHRYMLNKVWQPPSDNGLLHWSWSDQEKHEAFKHARQMDIDIMVWADKTFTPVDEKFLERVVSPCILSLDFKSGEKINRGMCQILAHRWPKPDTTERALSAPSKDTQAAIALDMSLNVVSRALEIGDKKKYELDGLLRSMNLFTACYNLQITDRGRYDILIDNYLEGESLQFDTPTISISRFQKLYASRAVFSICWNMFFATESRPGLCVGISAAEKLIAYAKWTCTAGSGYARADCIAACAVALQLTHIFPELAQFRVEILTELETFLRNISSGPISECLQAVRRISEIWGPGHTFAPTYEALRVYIENSPESNVRNLNLRLSDISAVFHASTLFDLLKSLGGIFKTKKFPQELVQPIKHHFSDLYSISISARSTTDPYPRQTLLEILNDPVYQEPGLRGKARRIEDALGQMYDRAERTKKDSESSSQVELS